MILPYQSYIKISTYTLQGNPCRTTCHLYLEEVVAKLFCLIVKPVMVLSNGYIKLSTYTVQSNPNRTKFHLYIEEVVAKETLFQSSPKLIQLCQTLLFLGSSVSLSLPPRSSSIIAVNWTWHSTMSSPRTGNWSLIRFKLGQNWDLYKTNKSKFLAGWIKAIILGPQLPSF